MEWSTCCVVMCDGVVVWSGVWSGVVWCVMVWTGVSMPYHTIPYHTIPCHAMPCHAMPCHAMPCHAMPCFALFCSVLLCSALWPGYAWFCCPVTHRVRNGRRHSEQVRVGGAQLVAQVSRAQPPPCTLYRVPRALRPPSSMARGQDALSK